MRYGKIILICSLPSRFISERRRPSVFVFRPFAGLRHTAREHHQRIGNRLVHQGQHDETDNELAQRTSYVHAEHDPRVRK